ncbi:MAG: hypothetical protein GTO53_06295, partial [Planctomycetales bacterium]|nr:hypothetical protein [Planctomycetales bacterium]NIN77569.1 hypothetical protein [Planctomycetales bacterium]
MPNLLNLFLALDGRAPDLANLSDAEILTRFPLLGISSLVLLVAGLGCD